MVAVLALMNPLGTMVGFVIPYAFIDPNAANDRIKTQTFFYLMAETGFMFFLSFLTVIFIRGVDKSKSQHAVGSVVAGSLATGSLQEQLPSSIKE